MSQELHSPAVQLPHTCHSGEVEADGAGQAQSGPTAHVGIVDEQVLGNDRVDDPDERQGEGGDHAAL